MRLTGWKQWIARRVVISRPLDVEKATRAVVARQVSHSFLSALDADGLVLHLMHRQDQADARASYISWERRLRRHDPEALRALEQDAALQFPDGREGVVVFRTTVGAHANCQHASASEAAQPGSDSAVVNRFLTAHGRSYEPALVSVIQAEVNAVLARRKLPFEVNKIDLQLRSLADPPDGNYALEAVAVLNLLELHMAPVLAKLDQFS